MTTRRAFLEQLTAVTVAAGACHSRALAAIAPWPASSPAATASAPWTRKQGPLMTRWAAAVDPEHPLPEYPRPQFVRKQWLSLNGIWEFQPGSDGDSTPVGEPLAGFVCVPFGVESALSGVMEHHDRMWYRRVLTLPPEWKGQRVLLHCDAIDWESEIWVNGSRVGVHRGGYDPFTYDITPHLKPADNEILIRVFDPTERGGQPRGKQVTTPAGIMYTPTSGIWQTIWLEPVPTTYLVDMLLEPDIDAGQLGLTFDAVQASHEAEILVRIKDGARIVQTHKLQPGIRAQIAMPHARLWSPDTPFLYGLEIELRSGKKVLDTVSSYFAMRKFAVGKDADDKPQLMLNNEAVFAKGPLDQGFWPDGIYTAPTDEALRSDIEAMKAMGFNFVRKHIKVEPARWYHYCDTLGLMVWQDMPSCDSYTPNPPPIDTEAYKRELTRLILTKRNTPSIVQWVPFNEGQGQKAFDTGAIVALIRSLDPTPRTIDEASGGDIHGFGDVNDTHNYPEPTAQQPSGKQATVCGEFGGVGFFVPGHSWQASGKSYVMVSAPDDLLYFYAELLAQIGELRKTKSLSAFVYTEFTDVMTEINGMLAYDRTPKLPFDKIKQINDGLFPPPVYRDIVATSRATPQLWRMATESPMAGSTAWRDLSFDDSGWQDAKGVFGNYGSPGTSWSSGDLWLRKRFHMGALTEPEQQATVLTLLREGASEVYVNGMEANMQRGSNHKIEPRYEHRPLLQEVRRALVPNGENVIAVHCMGGGARQIFDCGLACRTR